MILRSVWRRRSGTTGSIRTLRILLKISAKMRAKTELPKDHTDYLNPAPIPALSKNL